MYLWKDIPRRTIDAVPFFACQMNFACLAAIPQSVDIHRADDWLHFCRMAQKPGDGDGRVAHFIFGRNFINRLIQFRELVVSKEYAFKESVLEWRPRLDGDIVQPAKIKHASIPVDGCIIFHVHIDPIRDHGGVGDA